MKEIIFEIRVTQLQIDELSNEFRKLAQKALKAAETAYAFYSHFQVGAAALLANGEIVCGSNQENAAYPSGLCAERVALFYAGAQYPGIPVCAIAVAAISDGKQVQNITPCGACRQVLLEVEKRYNSPVKILLYNKSHVSVIESAKALLPLCFNGDELP
ncbi:cytidine deaminase [Parabacteroides chinchillae]|uniref:Cytidine deaminase n=1 Tax=Parabacteroides chinchillae TaxID=871327 RepID=A0A8G2BYM3_9BACT|nr:cytidine deaminase [Parabacteroides chinchillae]SEG21684.1 cytidine deaminase [Parabacteroides chinchillae]